MALLKADKAAAAVGTPVGPGVLLDANPFAPTRASRKGGVRANAINDSYGFCSIEDFPAGIGDLGATHEDAQGFYDYVRQFDTPNFWFRDGSVLSWIYGETYDNWQDLYGFDATKVVYHSGHGTMDGNGVFWMPMGGAWSGASWASSTDMRLGNEMARYLFLSTCLSLRVKDGHSPIRTWDASNLGLRMLFGFETVSVDSGDYGRNFWQEWNRNKSFSSAWLDASWRIDTGQEPCVAACGATAAEAQDRLANERLFYTTRASKNYYWWRWYNAARRIEHVDAELPELVRSAIFEPPDVSGARLAAAAEHYGIRLAETPELPRGSHGIVLGSGEGEPTLTVDADGVHEVRFASPDGSGRDAPSGEEAVRLAQAAVESFGLADQVDLIADRVRHAYTAGAAREDSEVIDPRIQETTVVLTQVVDGVPIVTPGMGEVRVSIDGSGTVTRIVDATRVVADLRDRATTVAPPEQDQPSGPRGASASTVDDVLDGRVQRLLRRMAAGGRVPTGVRTIGDSTDVGFSMRGADGVMVARRTVEIDCGEGLSKRYVIEEALNG